MLAGELVHFFLANFIRPYLIGGNTATFIRSIYKLVINIHKGDEPRYA